MLISASFVLLLFTTFWRCELFDGMEDQYSILIRFDTQDSTDKFYLHFNGRQYNSLEEEACQVLFTVDIQFTGYSGSLEHSQPSTTSTAEQPSCPVCLGMFCYHCKSDF